jgi:hypothetical protein
MEDEVVCDASLVVALWEMWWPSCEMWCHNAAMWRWAYVGRLGSMGRCMVVAVKRCCDSVGRCGGTARKRGDSVGRCGGTARKRGGSV